MTKARDLASNSTGSKPTLIDAKGDLLVGTAADTAGRLAVGTNGHTLVADSSVSPQGLKWAVDPVADVVTTAGDLIYGSAADTVARLGIGTAGQVLKVNSGATAPEWGAASSTPTFVGCAVYNSGNFAVANNSDVKVTYNSFVFDTDAFHSTVTNTSRITIPAGKGGKYLFFAWGQMAANATGYRQAYFWVNNSSATRFAIIKANPISASLTADFYVSGIVDLVATDYVEHIMFQNSGGNLNLLGGLNDGQFGCIYLGA